MAHGVERVAGGHPLSALISQVFPRAARPVMMTLRLLAIHEQLDSLEHLGAVEPAVVVVADVGDVGVVCSGKWIGNPFRDTFSETEACPPELDRAHVAELRVHALVVVPPNVVV